MILLMATSPLWWVLDMSYIALTWCVCVCVCAGCKEDSQETGTGSEADGSGSTRIPSSHLVCVCVCVCAGVAGYGGVFWCQVCISSRESKVRERERERCKLSKYFSLPHSNRAALHLYEKTLKFK